MTLLSPRDTNRANAPSVEVDPFREPGHVADERDKDFLTPHAPVAIDGRSGRLVGRVSMDMLTVDLTGHPEAGVGSRVELWGSQVPAAQVVAHSQTSSYRLLCAVKRVPLEYRG